MMTWRDRIGGEEGGLGGRGYMYGIKIARRNINNLRYANDTTLMAESEEELKSLLMKVIKDFIFFSSKITADGDCSHEIKRRLLLGMP